MRHPRMAVLFGVLAICALLIVRGNDAVPIYLLTMAFAGACSTLLYRPSTNALFLGQRAFTRRDLPLMLVMIVYGWTACALLEQAFLRPDFAVSRNGGAYLSEVAAWSLGIGAMSIGMAPALRQMLAGLHRPDRDPPLWPASVGATGGFLLGFAILMAWEAVGKPAPKGTLPYKAELLIIPSLVPMLALLLGIALPLWWRALMARSEVFVVDGIWTAAMRCAGAGLWLGIAVSICTLLVISGDQTLSFDALCAWMIGSVIAAGWALALHKVASVEPQRRWGAVLAVTSLFFAIPASMFPAVIILGTGEWAIIFAFGLFPVGLGVAAIVRAFAPKILNAMIGVSPRQNFAAA